MWSNMWVNKRKCTVLGNNNLDGKVRSNLRETDNLKPLPVSNVNLHPRFRPEIIRSQKMLLTK